MPTFDWERMQLQMHGIPYNTRHGEARAHGKVISLGFGIQPKPGRFGMHPLIWYVAMGYLSGFPIRHVLWWVWRYKLSPKARREERADASVVLS